MKRYTDSEIEGLLIFARRNISDEPDRTSLLRSSSIDLVRAVEQQRTALLIAKIDHRRVNGARLAHKANAEYLREMLGLAKHALEDNDQDQAKDIISEALAQVPA